MPMGDAKGVARRRRRLCLGDTMMRPSRFIVLVDAIDAMPFRHAARNAGRR